MKAAVLLGLFSAVLAVPAPQTAETGATGEAAAPAATDVDSNACGVVSESYSRQKASNSKDIPRVSAAQAFACLQTVPNKREQAMRHVTSFKAYVQWESTLAYLKDPPKSYGLPAVDIMGGLDMIMQNVSNGSYQSEYEFQAKMTQLVGLAHDGHFAYRPDVFKAFGFRNDLAMDLVSLSVDGKAVPKLYHLTLVNGSTTTIANVSLPLDSNGLPPAVTKINGQDAASVIVADGLQFLNSQDQDSQWNGQFQTYASPTAFPVVGGSIYYRGDSVTFEYENGQTITQDSYAIIRPTADFSRILTGEDFYQRFCNPDAAESGTIQQPTPMASNNSGVSPNIPGFPNPEIRDSGAGVTSGYFLKGQGYDDVAVLSVTGFAPATADFDSLEYIQNFQNMTGQFLAKSKAAGKKRLVVDVTANGGGLVVAGYELYSQIFPNTPLFQADNIRRSDSLVQISSIANDNLDKILQLQPGDGGRNSSKEVQALVALAQSDIIGNLLPGGVFSAGNRINYTTTAQIIAPVRIHGDVFTAYQSTPNNATDPVFNLTGTGNRANPPAAVFDPENVVILTDGNCGSTCTLFSYLMIMQQNIKTVSVGGRPQTGQMQSIGGVEGAQVFDLESIQQAAAAAMSLAPASMQAKLNESEMGIIAQGYALDRAAVRGGAGAVNGKNAFSHTDAQTPLQFLYQPANCKIFYTKDMVYGPEATWKRAVDAAFNDPNQFCVEGSQTPLMGVQQPTAAFFTADAEGRVDASGTTVVNNGQVVGSSSGAVAGPSVGVWFVVFCAALVSMVVTI